MDSTDPALSSSLRMHRLSLDGPWRLRWYDGVRGARPAHFAADTTDLARSLEATVPGEVHLDLLRHGLIPDFETHADVRAVRWVEECLWLYRREFEVPADARAARRCWLVFEQLDLVANVFLNGQLVGQHANVFYPCRLDVTGKLRPGTNVLMVQLDSGLFHAGDKPAAGYTENWDAKLHKRHWLRKPQSQFGWDWSPRLVNVGISGSACLEWSDAPLRVEAFVPLATLSDDLTSGQVRGRLIVENLTAEPIGATLSLRIDGTDARVETPVTIAPGTHAAEATVTLASPRPWWPIGLGAQSRYDVEVSLRPDGAAEPIFRGSKHVGFRTARFETAPAGDEHGGTRFVLHVNGRAVFCKGGNLVPADLVLCRVDPDRYATLVERAIEANFNFLRVWGGGLYEADAFYDLCDERGVLVWQEFVFACARYPNTDQAFHEDVKREARHNIRRLAHHPSLVAWCGNNEQEWGSWSWNFDWGIVHPDHALYHLTLPRLLREEDPTRHYQPSSPFSPGAEHPNADHVGDQHPWTVGFANTDFRDYRRMFSRFANEGGILGPTSLPTMRECLPPNDQAVQGFAWTWHDNSIDSWRDPSAPDAMLQQWLGLEARWLSVEDFTYWAGLLQGEGLREYVDNFRRRMFDSAAAIFWMFNDVWPATRSWTIVDHRLRRTPSFHPVRRAMAPLSVGLVEEADRIAIYGINDRDTPVRGELRFGVLSLAGGPYPLDRREPTVLLPNASTRLASFPRSAWNDDTRELAFAVLSESGQVVARNRLIRPLFKELHWPALDPAADIRIAVRDGVATFACGRFAFNVCLDLDGERRLADNFFDLYPDQLHRIAWTLPDPPRVLRVGNDLPRPIASA